MLDRDFSLCSDLCPNKTNTFDTDENCEKVMKSLDEEAKERYDYLKKLIVLHGEDAE